MAVPITHGLFAPQRPRGSLGPSGESIEAMKVRLAKEAFERAAAQPPLPPSTQTQVQTNAPASVGVSTQPSAQGGTVSTTGGGMSSGSSSGGASGGGGIGGGGGLPPSTPITTSMSPETAALMSLEAAEAPTQLIAPTEGVSMLRTLGRRLYPQESMALASMGRVY